MPLRFIQAQLDLPRSTVNEMGEVLRVIDDARQVLGDEITAVLADRVSQEKRLETPAILPEAVRYGAQDSTVGYIVVQDVVSNGAAFAGRWFCGNSPDEEDDLQLIIQSQQGWDPADLFYTDERFPVVGTQESDSTYQMTVIVPCFEQPAAQVPVGYPEMLATIPGHSSGEVFSLGGLVPLIQQHGIIIDI